MRSEQAVRKMRVSRRLVQRTAKEPPVSKPLAALGNVLHDLELAEVIPGARVWWRPRDRTIANRLRASIDVLVAAAERFFEEHSPEDALRLGA